jgi:hypothetical protein
MIVVLLVIIILILAPWMLGVLVAAAALYGTWVLIVAGVSVVALVAILIALGIRMLFFPPETAADRLAARNREFNRKCMQEARQRREKAASLAGDASDASHTSDSR